METVRTTTDSDRIVTVWLDQPGKSVNTLTPTMLTELAEVLQSIEQSPPAGVIFASAKSHNFIAGADIFEIQKLDRDGLEKFLRLGQELFERISKLPMPTVAAINGDCLGGGLELALACRSRVAADDGSIKIGLPEVKLGILPAWGGTVRLPRTIGLTKALPLILAGKTLPPRKAAKAGIIDETVRPEALLDAAKRLAMRPPARRKLPLKDRLAAKPPMLNAVLSAARRQTEAQAHGHYPAPLRIIDVIRDGYTKDPAAGFEAERRALLDLSQTDTCRNLMRLFFLRQGSKRTMAKQLNADPREIKYAAVVGGGTMGAGIVHSLISAGIKVRLIEVDNSAISAALRRIQGMLNEDVRAGRIDALAARDAMNRVAPTDDWSGLALCDIAIEAVVERMDVKRDIFARLDKLTRPDAILASNTSSLSVAEMSAAVVDRGRLVGMHFFNPVPKMPLVEVIRTTPSDPRALATVVALAARMGKTPVLVNDSPGFLVNRVLIPYLAEAAMTADEGVPLERIDAAMKQWGWPMGPFELLDEIGLDVATHVLRSLVAKAPDYAAVPDKIGKAIERGWLGKKSGNGFYEYTGEGDRRERGKPNPELHALWGRKPGEPPTPASEEEIQWRLMLPMLNEAARLLSEGVVDSPDVVDLATVLGLGFPPFRGGLAHYADSIGAAEIERRSIELSSRLGPRFVPASLWHRLDEEHVPLERYSFSSTQRTEAEPAMSAK